MKRNKKMIAWLTALVMLIGGILIPGGSVTEAAAKKLSVSSEKSVAVNCSITIKTNVKATFKSSNQKIATANSKGVVKGKKAGKVDITVTSKSNRKDKKKITITVKDQLVITQPKNSKATLNAGQKLTIKTNVSSTFKSSDTTIATVNKSGIVTAKEAGTAKITVTSKTNKKSKKTVTITVKKKAEETTQAPDPEKPSEPVQPPEAETVPEVDWLYYYYDAYALWPSSLEMSIFAAINLPEDYDSIVEWGIIHTTENINDNNLVLYQPGIIWTTQLDKDRFQEWCRSYSFSQEEWDAKTPVKVRLYAIVKKGETTETVYSKVLSFTLTDE